MRVRVLIVDDHESFRRAAQAVVQGIEGFEVAGEVADGEASITAARTLRPDIILMDVNLPGINGIEATRQIRSVLPRVVVLLLSARDTNEFDRAAQDCGAAGYLAKARLSPEQLIELWDRERGRAHRYI